MLQVRWASQSRFEISVPDARVSYLLSDSIDFCSSCSIVCLESEVSIGIHDEQELQRE